MKKMATTLVLILLPVLGLCAEGPRPRLEVQHPSHDFGKVFQGSKVEHVFVFDNTGDAPLQILKVKSSCGCTAALVSEQTIAAGKTGEVRATFDSTNFTGVVQKKIYLQTNDSISPSKELTLYGEVAPVLAAEPPEIVIAGVAPGSSVRRTIRLMNRGPVPLRLEPAQATQPFFAVSQSEQVLEPGKSVELTLTVSPSADAGSFSGFLLIQARADNFFTLRIPVQGRVEGTGGSPK